MAGFNPSEVAAERDPVKQAFTEAVVDRHQRLAAELREDQARRTIAALSKAMPKG